MKSVFWFLFIAALAVALALLVGDNHATVTLFWHPYRIDLSFNLVLFALVGSFVLLYLALRGLALLRSLPEQAQRWRASQMERAVYAQVLDALAYQLSGRFVRAQSAAQQATELLASLPPQGVIHRAQLEVLAHLLTAEAAHALGSHDRRDRALAAAVAPGQPPEAGPAREGALLRAAAWALEARDAGAAQRWLADLPQGVARRIQAVRLKLRLAQLRHDTDGAIDMVRLLAKHRAFTRDAADSVLRGLLLDALRDTHDATQLQRLWQGLDSAERHHPDLALAMLERWQALAGSATRDGEPWPPAVQRLVQDALVSVWKGYDGLSDGKRRRWIVLLESALPRLDAQWLARVEEAQRARPDDAGLQYLAGQVFLQQRLWGKATFLLEQASRGLQDAELRRRTWRSLARLAEERGDGDAAQAAWKQAALV
ncbi:heme biosynthesis protein HemY [Aquabacterium sp. A08]|uniref:heme biosynthesis protein HemY n=1 Tax=Aquabacterium sp. A08 TaxID=2718532 RepID=UPI001421BDC1|nr:heme biosynthesis HemY N-terminal domain-containing protein [Aquabacterium sp. A08]NIC43132.1 heme biosynthesis protein HemY [Aquabacterium sp. A08]